MTSPNKTWQEEFDEFAKDYFIGFTDCGDNNRYLAHIDDEGMEEIKSFISKTLASQAQRLREAITFVNLPSPYAPSEEWLAGVREAGKAVLTAFDKALVDEV